MSTRRNILFNGIANVGSKLARIADQLLLVPFFLSTWGAGYYGEWLTLTTIPSVLAFSDLGFGTSACNAFVLSYAGNNFQKSANVFRTGLVINTGCVLLGILLSAIVMFVANHTGLLEKSLISASDAILALVFMMASRLIGFYHQLFEAMYRSKHRAATAINYITIEGLIRIGIGICVLICGGGIVAYSISNFIVALLFNIGFALIGLHIIGELPSGHFDRKEAKSICGKGLGYMASPLWQAIYFQGSTFVVRIVLGAESVAVFNTVRTVCRSINQLFNIVSASVFPELQMAIGRNEMGMAQNLLVRSIQYVMLLAIVGIVVLCTFGPTLYAWWTNNQLLVPDDMWYIFMLGIAFNAVWWTAACVFRAVNEPYRFALYGIVSSIVSVGITYILSEYYSLFGSAIGYVVLDIIMAILVLPYALKKINLNIKSLFIHRICL